MSVKDFFAVVIKIFSIYILVQGIIPIVNNFIYFYQIDDVGYLFIFIGVVLVFFAIMYLMLSQAHKIVRFLRLDKGFDVERFDFSNAKSSTILEISFAVIGVYTTVIGIPSILLYIYSIIKNNINNYSFHFGGAEILRSDFYIDLLYVLVGIIIIFLRKPIANIFTPKSQ